MDTDVSEDYKKHLDLCSRFDTWRLKTACSLITGGLPEYAGGVHPREQTFAEIYEAAVSCANFSLALVDANARVEDYRVFPAAFTHWAAMIGFNPDPAYTPKMDASIIESKWTKADDLEEIQKLFKEATGQRLPSKIAARLRAFSDKSKSKWRCRGLAAYFWSIDSSMSAAEVARKPEILQFGCDGKFPGDRQMREWIADLNPSPKAGRPRGK